MKKRKEKKEELLTRSFHVWYGLSSMIFWAFFREQPAISVSSSTVAFWKKSRIWAFSLGSFSSASSVSESKSNGPGDASKSLASSSELLSCFWISLACCLLLIRVSLSPFRGLLGICCVADVLGFGVRFVLLHSGDGGGSEPESSLLNSTTERKKKEIITMWMEVYTWVKKFTSALSLWQIAPILLHYHIWKEIA